MLPWGQMSYWTHMVNTNLFGGVPVVGDALVVWIRGVNVALQLLQIHSMLHVFSDYQ